MFELEAIYENGVLKLLKPLELPNGTKVKIIISKIMLSREKRVDLALKLLKRGMISVGKAAEIAGMDYRSFLDEMGKRGVEFPYDEEELRKDIKTAEILSKVETTLSREERIDLALKLLRRGEISIKKPLRSLDKL